MIHLVLFIVTFIAFFIFMYFEEGEFAFLIGLEAFLVAFFVLFCSVLITSFFTSPKNRERVTDYTTAISCLDDKREVYLKSHILLSSSSDYENKYLVMVAEEDGWVCKEYDADKCIVVETNDVEPHIEKFKYVYNKEKHPYRAFWYGSDLDYSDGYEYKIYIPCGTISNDYNIDLN